MIEERFVITWDIHQTLWEKLRNKQHLSGVLGANFPTWETALEYMYSFYNVPIINWMVSDDHTQLRAVVRTEDNKVVTYGIVPLVTSHDQIDLDLV